MSSLIAGNGTILFDKARASGSVDAQASRGMSGSGSGSAASNGSSSEQDTSGDHESGTIDAFSGDSSGNASGAGSGGTVKPEYMYTASALLQVNVKDGKGIQCSDVGQYECIAGINHQRGDIVNVAVSLAKEGKI